MKVEHIYFPEDTLLLGLPVIAKKGTFLAILQNNTTIILQGYKQLRGSGEFVSIEDFPMLSYHLYREETEQGETYL